jgi:hypothetical protein
MKIRDTVPSRIRGNLIKHESMKRRQPSQKTSRKEKNRYPHLNKINSNNKLYAREKLTVRCKFSYPMLRVLKL